MEPCRFYILDLQGMSEVSASPMSVHAPLEESSVLAHQISSVLAHQISSVLAHQIHEIKKASKYTATLDIDFNDLLSDLSPSLAKALWYSLAKRNNDLPNGARAPKTSVLRDLCEKIRSKLVVLAEMPPVKSVMAQLLAENLESAFTRKLTEPEQARLRHRALRWISFGRSRADLEEDHSPLWSPMLQSFGAVGPEVLQTNWLVQLSHDLYNSGRYSDGVVEPQFPAIASLSRTPVFLDGDELVFTFHIAEISGKKTDDLQLVFQHRAIVKEEAASS